MVAKRAFRKVTRSISSLGYQVLVAALIFQLACPQFSALAAPSDPPSESPLPSPSDHPFSAEVKAGAVHAASRLDFLGQQELRDAKVGGVYTKNQPLHKPSFNRSVVSLGDFDLDVTLSVVDPSHTNHGDGALIFARGEKDRKTGTFVASVEHVIHGISLLANPLTEDNFIFLVTEEDGRPEAIRMISKDLFVGSNGVRGSGFYSDIPVVRAISLKHLPLDWTVEGFEYFSLDKKPEVLFDIHTLQPVSTATMPAVGDKILRVKTGAGESIPLWASNESLIEGFEKRSIGLVLVAMQDNGGFDAEEIALLEAFLKGLEEDQAEARKQQQEILTEIDARMNDSGVMDVAVLALRRLNLRWMLPHLTRLDVKELGPDLSEITVRRSAFGRIAHAPRERFPADPSPDSRWSRTHTQLRSAMDRAGVTSVGPKTADYANLLLAEERAVIESIRPAWDGALARVHRRTKDFLSKALTPTRTAFLGTLVAGAATPFYADSQMGHFLGAMGTRILEMCRDTPAQNLVGPVEKFGQFASQNILGGSEGLLTLARWGGGVSISLSLFFLVHLSVWGYAKYRGSSAGFSWKDVSHETLTRLSHLYCMLQRGLQERLTNLVQPNFYRYIYNTGSTAGAMSTLSLPWNQQQTAAEVNSRLAGQENIRSLASRLAGLVLAAQEQGVSPEVLALAERRDSDLRTLIAELQLNPKTRSEFLSLRLAIFSALTKIYEQGDSSLGDEAVSRQAYEKYVQLAQRVKSAALPGAESGFLSALFLSSCQWASTKLRAAVSFGLDVALGLPNGHAANTNQGREVSDEVRTMVLGMAVPDYVVSTLTGAAQDPVLYSIPRDSAEIGQTAGAVVSSVEQAAAWNMVVVPDIQGVLAAQTQMANFFPPIATAFHDPSQGGVGRQESLEGALLGVLKGVTDPSVESAGFFKSWIKYMRSAIQGHQVRALVLGASIVSGFAVTGHHSPINSVLLGLITAYYVAFRKISLSTDFSALSQGHFDLSAGYAVPWPIANTAIQQANKGPEQNKELIRAAAGLLASVTLADVKKGAYLMKQLYAQGQGWFSHALPAKFNISADQYTAELGAELLEYARQPNQVPVPTEPSQFFDQLVNMTAVLGTVVVYFAMYDSILSNKQITVSQALLAAGEMALWFGATAGVVSATGKVSPYAARLVTPFRTLGEKAYKVGQSCAHSLLGIQSVDTSARASQTVTSPLGNKVDISE